MYRCITIGGFSPVNYGVVTVDSHCSVIVRDRESEDISIELFFTIYKPDELKTSLTAKVATLHFIC